MNSMLKHKYLPELIFIILVFILQPYKVGFEEGHHGWVSSHVLSQISRASEANHFLGYSKDILTEGGKVDKVYFDRYPIFFAAISHQILKPFWDNLESTIYVARQMMNVIYILIMLLMLRLTKKLSDDPYIQYGVFFLVSSSSYFVFYKDMVHFDQPAILGSLILLNGIVDYIFLKKRKWLIWGSLIGPLMGRGYFSLFVLLTWVVWESVLFLTKTKLYSKDRFKMAILSFVLAVPLPILSLGINIYSEAKIRGVSFEKTSIVISASHRLGLEQYKNAEGAKKVKWLSYILKQTLRTLDLMTPYALYGLHIHNYKKPFIHYLTLLPKMIYQLFIFWGLVKFLKRRKFIPFLKSILEDQRKFVQLILLSSGILWLLVMKNLAAFHEYVSMYGFGISILFCYYILKKSKQNKILFTLFPLIFILSLSLNFIFSTQIASKVNWQAETFQNIRETMKRSQIKVAYLDLEKRKIFFPKRPYVEHFFLSDFIVSYFEVKPAILMKLKNDKLEWITIN
jgi:hypothetical protein